MGAAPPAGPTAPITMVVLNTTAKATAAMLRPRFANWVMADLLAEPGVFFTAPGGYAECFAGPVPILVRTAGTVEVTVRANE
jgi:hypothetical protein